jgi:hypothetical protein
MKRFETDCDMGSIKIYTEDASWFFSNGIGDVPTAIDIKDSLPKTRKNNDEFLGHFTVKTEGTVFLSFYDCEDDKVYTFPVGRWFVYRKKRGAHIVIQLTDLDTYA